MTRPMLALWLAAVICVVNAAVADESAPATRVAYVASRVALGRSGPSMDDYPTDVLPIGERVEILERQEAWAGIRPPRGSFSWIEASQVTRLEGQAARVTSEQADVWIGSSVSPVTHHAEQVRLRKGELVQVLEEKTVDAAGASSTWLKIRPPVGELRWVKDDELSAEPPVPEPAAATGAADAPLESGDEESSARAKVSSSPRAATEPREDAESVFSRASLPRVRRETHDNLVWVDRHTGQAASSSRSEYSVSNTPLGALEERTFDDRFTILQLKIARACARGATSAEARRLEDEVERLIRDGGSPYERGRAALLLENVRELQSLTARRTDQIEPASFDLGPLDARPIGSGTRSPSNSDARDQEGDERQDPTSDPAYVTTGWLMPVSAPDRAAPPFVVMDSDGHPVAFVTPAPGLNLRRYVDKEVGIVGDASFEVLDRRHVIAHRVVELDRHRGSAAEPRPAVPWIRFRRTEP